MNQQTTDFLKKTSTESIKKVMQDSMGYVTIALLSIVYLATSFVELAPSGKSMRQIFVEGFAYAVLSLAIERLFSMQGVRSGERDQRYISTIRLHGEAVERVVKWFDRLEAWCKKKTIKTLVTARVMILESEGMPYEKYFNDRGEALGYVRRNYPKEYLAGQYDTTATELRKARQRKAWDRSEARRERCYQRAVRHSITPLTAGTLTGGSWKASDPFDFGTTTLEHETKEGKAGLVVKTAAMFAAGYLGVTLIEDFSYEMLILRALQISLSLAMGVLRYYRSYLYVVEEYRGKIIKKIDCLQMFEAAMKREEEKNNGQSESRSAEREEAENGGGAAAGELS